MSIAHGHVFYFISLVLIPVQMNTTVSATATIAYFN